jgi:hypothetical protein
MTRTTKAAKAKAKAKKPAAKKAGKAKATRPTTIIGKMRSALTRKPQTMRQLMAKAGTELSQYEQMRRLCEKGLAARNEDGHYTLP